MSMFQRLFKSGKSQTDQPAQNAKTAAPKGNIFEVLKKNDPKALTKFIGNGGDVNEKDASGKTALVHATFDHNPVIAKILVEAGADPNVQFSNGLTALMVASGGMLFREVAGVLLDAGADVNLQADSGLTALLAAVQSDNAALVERLLAAGADVNRQSADGATALMAATDSARIMELLIAKHPDLNLKENVNGFSALTGAAWKGKTDAVRLLIHAGADVNLKANNDRTALMAAAAQGFSEIVKLLIDAKADVNVKETQAGMTALKGAEKNGHTEVVAMLKKAGAKG